MTSLLLIGCGNMGSALLARWEAQTPAVASSFFVIEPNTPHAHSHQTHYFKTLTALPDDHLPQVVVLAVKPQLLDAVLPECVQRFKHARPLYLSIAAGKPLSFYQQHLGAHAHVVRAMPNTPALVGKGMTTLCANNTLPESYKHTAGALMQAVGKIAWIEETHMDTATAISGSGPAYVFLFLEALCEAGIDAGLAPDMARELALATLHGSVHLAEKSHETFAGLRKNVTSPGGTTEAALQILMKDQAFIRLMKEAIQKAENRSRALAQQPL